MAIQLRVYTINRGKMNDFVRAWVAGVYPLRHAYGFTIPKAWTNAARNEFIWLLSYDGDDWERAEAAYYASPERTTLDPDPAQYIAQPNASFIEEIALPALIGQSQADE